jgi:TRAP-type C4-dicarboxylate transport system substrate-binding protein
MYLYQIQIGAFMDYLNNETDYAFEFETYPGGELGGPTEALNLVQGDAADISMVVPAYLSESFPLTSGFELPGFNYPIDELSKGLWAMTQGFLEENEYSDQGIKAVLSAMVPPAQVGTKETKFTETDSLDGLSLRSTGGIMNRTMKALGASPVQISGPDMYAAVERGTVSGLMTHLPGMRDYSMQEVINHATRNGDFGSNSMIWFMSQSKFDSLSEGKQDAILEAGKHAGLNNAEELSNEVEKVVGTFKDAGVDVYDVPEDVLSELNENEFTRVQNAWAEDQGDKGQAFLKEFEEQLG